MGKTLKYLLIISNNCVIVSISKNEKKEATILINQILSCFFLAADRSGSFGIFSVCSDGRPGLGQAGPAGVGQRPYRVHLQHRLHRPYRRQCHGHHYCISRMLWGHEGTVKAETYKPSNLKNQSTHSCQIALKLMKGTFSFWA